MAALDAMSGERKCGGPQSGKRYDDQPAGWSGGSNNIGSRGDSTRTVAGYTDTGGASRFFLTVPIESGDELRMAYIPKASRRERNAGLDGLPERERGNVSQFMTGTESNWINDPRHPNGGYEIAPAKPQSNHHPTVKPIALMRWLVRLVCQPGQTVYDPFTGSGTTGIAAVLEGVRFVGSELSPEYLEIARRRIAHWTPKPEAVADLPLFAQAAD